MVVGFGLILLMATCFGLLTYWQQRRSGYASWYHGHWKKVDRARRRRIARSVRRGEAVADPRDAALALELIDHQQRRFGGDHGARRPWLPRLHFVLLALLALSVGLTSDFKLIGFALVPVGSVLTLRLVVQRLEARIAAAHEKNEQLAGRFS